jgi:RNA polymerase sigma-70 factor (ECF subfamily)
MPDPSLPNATDGLLVVRTTDGDTWAFEVLLRRHTRLMRSYAIQLTGSPADADDAVQEAFIAAWNSLDTLHDPDAVKPWLMRIVSRKAIDRIRARHVGAALGSEDRLTLSEPGPEQLAVVHSELAAVADILNSLPELQRQCWILKEAGGYTYQEIAAGLGVPLPTVRGALARARRTVIRGMEDWS